jgi:rhamnose utilization protein RhaD (predicted bifunctional aldolase and dehydrogenase)
MTLAPEIERSESREVGRPLPRVHMLRSKKRWVRGEEEEEARVASRQASRRVAEIQACQRVGELQPCGRATAGEIQPSCSQGRRACRPEGGSALA